MIASLTRTATPLTKAAGAVERRKISISKIASAALMCCSDSKQGARAGQVWVRRGSGISLVRASGRIRVVSLTMPLLNCAANVRDKTAAALQRRSKLSRIRLTRTILMQQVVERAAVALSLAVLMAGCSEKSQESSRAKAQGDSPLPKS